MESLALFYLFSPLSVVTVSEIGSGLMIPRCSESEGESFGFEEVQAPKSSQTFLGLSCRGISMFQGQPSVGSEVVNFSCSKWMTLSNRDHISAKEMLMSVFYAVLDVLFSVSSI